MDVDDEQASAWVDAALVDYNARREELLAGQRAQQHTLTLGAVTVGIVVTGAFQVWDEQILATVAFLGVIPLVSLLVVTHWAALTTGIIGFGIYLRGLEDALLDAYGQSVPEPVLRWERFIAERETKPWRHEGVAIASFVLMSWASIGLGGYRLSVEHKTAAILTAVLVSLVTATVAAFLFHAVDTARSAAHENADDSEPVPPAKAQTDPAAATSPSGQP